MGKNLSSERFFQINSRLFETSLLCKDNNYDIIGRKLPPTLVETRVRTINFANFGLITNRKKNDCSKDWSTVKNEDLLSLTEKVSPFGGDEKLPEFYNRIQTLPVILDELIEGIPGPSIELMVRNLMWKHTRSFHKILPKLPFKEMVYSPRGAAEYVLGFSKFVSTQPLSILRETYGFSPIWNKSIPDLDYTDVYKAYKKSCSYFETRRAFIGPLPQEIIKLKVKFPGDVGKWPSLNNSFKESLCALDGRTVLSFNSVKILHYACNDVNCNCV
jgi:hypothetical protein